MSAIFLFISTLYLKQQTNILRCFSILKFQKSLFKKNLFRYVFRSEKVYTAENDQIKYFTQNYESVDIEIEQPIILFLLKVI